MFIISTVANFETCFILTLPPTTIRAVPAYSADDASYFVGMGGNSSVHLLALPSPVRLNSWLMVVPSGIMITTNKSEEVVDDDWGTDMEPPRWECIAAVLLNNQLMVVGGRICKKFTTDTDSTELAAIELYTYRPNWFWCSHKSH